MLSRPALPLIFIGLISHAPMSLADPVDATRQWTNTSKATLVALRVGKQTIAVLEPCQAVYASGSLIERIGYITSTWYKLIGSNDL